MDRIKSRPVSRVLSRAIIPLGSVSPRTSSGLPGSARGSTLPRTREGQGYFPIWPCSRWGLPCRRVLPPTRCALTAPFHPYRSREGLRRFAFCCTFRGLTPPRRYLAPDPQEPGLSSTPPSGAAIARPTLSCAQYGYLPRSQLRSAAVQPQRTAQFWLIVARLTCVMISTRVGCAVGHVPIG